MRHWWVPAMLTGAVLIAGVCIAITPGPPRPCRATFEQVQEGMTAADVEATVGGPPGYYGPGKDGEDVFTMPRGLKWTMYESWVCDEGELLVKFRDGRVETVSVWNVIVLPRPSLWARLRAWAGL